MTGRLGTTSRLLALAALGFGALGLWAPVFGDETDPAAIPPPQTAVSSDDLRTLVRRAAETRGLSPDLADALVEVESGYRPGFVGRFGEMGLMQVRPATARMLGFRGAFTGLFEPGVNVEVGMAHLAQAWLVAKGDLCSTLVKYRSHYAEEQSTPDSMGHCRRVRYQLAALGSPLGEAAAPAVAAVKSDGPLPAAAPTLAALGQATPPDPSELLQPKAEAGPLAAPTRPLPGGRARFLEMITQAAEANGLPAAIADAVVRVESSYDPSAIGGVGEVGLMQVRHSTAAMLGFPGSAADLADPATNIRYGVAYLARAWRLAGGDLCRALMKYRAGHGEERMTPLSVQYCQRARNHLAAIGAPIEELESSAAASPPGQNGAGPSKLALAPPPVAKGPVREAAPVVAEPAAPVVRTARVELSFWAANRARLEDVRASHSVMHRQKEIWAEHGVRTTLLQPRFSTASTISVTR